VSMLKKLCHEIVCSIAELFNLDLLNSEKIEIKLNVDKSRKFGDVSCNAGMVLAKKLNMNPRQIAEEIKNRLEAKTNNFLFSYVDSIEVAGPGFLNIALNNEAWSTIANQMFDQKEEFFKLGQDEKKLKYLVEFVSANPTGPMHLGHGRGGIIGDVLSRVAKFLGHSVEKEFYINDSGKQIQLLGRTFKVRCLQALGIDELLPEGGYAGEYLVSMAEQCAEEFGEALHKKDESFFENYAKEKLLENLKCDLKEYGIIFNNWFSEKSLHEKGSVDAAIEILKNKNLVYEKEGALWFKASGFGDDKDRVIKRSGGELTYIAADIAYHKDKFDRGYDKIIDVLGQDHHGYVKRLKATMEAMGFDAERLHVILYQLVTLKKNDVSIRMSKRAGTFTTLIDVIETVGCDVARFFYLNRKAEAHLDFDLEAALKKTDENPVYYIQYAYVRTNSIFEKAGQEKELSEYLEGLKRSKNNNKFIEEIVVCMGDDEIVVLRKMLQLFDVLNSIANTHQTHLLSYYSWELANLFHTYYANNRVINLSNLELTKMRLLLVVLVRQALGVCLDLLGLSCPEKM
jgi:arginyl-tRNA synthetase